MKNSVRKIVIIILMVFAAGMSVFFMNQAYQAYKNYHISQKSDLYIAFLHQLDVIVQGIEQERILSALYLGYEGKTDFHQLEMKRGKSDLLIMEASQFIKQNPEFTDALETLKMLSGNLQYVRSRVDVVNPEYDDILFKYYQDEIIKLLLTKMQNEASHLSQGLPNLQRYLKTYVDFAVFRDDLSLEDSFLAFILSRSQKMSMHDLSLWENILAHEKFPNLQLLNDASMILQITTALHPQQFLYDLSNVRIGILKGVNNAHYAISVMHWLAKMDEKIKAINDSEEIIYDYLQSSDQQDLSPLDLVINLSIAVALLLGLIWLFVKFRQENRSAAKEIISPEIKFAKVEPKQEEVPRHVLQTQELPLSNMQPKIQPQEPEQTTVPLSPAAVPSQENFRREDKTFYAIEEFKSVIKPFIPEAERKNIDFHYEIDPYIPEICVGDIDKIKQFLRIFLTYAMHVTPSKKPVFLEIENIAQKKFETAINFTIKDSGRFIDSDERIKIKNGIASRHTFLPDVFTHDREKTDLSFAGRLVLLLDGRLDIQSKQHQGTTVSVTLNLKKFISVE